MYHYNAFISYNHNPRDMKIARTLQQRLENYKIPEDIKSNTSTEKIERIFLDKGELEASGDLNKAILDALGNSDHLIVICSPESRDSIWVQREIEFYLQSHSIDSILTVITEGEPFDVIPEILLYEETTDEEGISKRVSLEPLSADYRLPINQANKEELPRIASAIIGCRYDDLMQRQKAYRLRRNMTILSMASMVLVASAMYLVWSNHQIKTNFNNSLREQSINLALQSERALTSGDRLGAIRYALDGLPSEGNDRPVVSSAVKALADATRIYKSKSSETWTAIRTFPLGGKSIKTIISNTSSNSDYFVELFNNGSVVIRNVESGEEVHTDYIEELTSSVEDNGIIDCVFIERNVISLITKNNISVLDLDTGKERFRLDFTAFPGNEELGSYTNDTFTSNKYLYLPIRVYKGDSENDHIIIHQLDPSTGKIRASVDTGMNDLDSFAVSDDDRYLAAIHSIYGSNDPDQVYTFDMDGNQTEIQDTPEYITDVMFTPDNMLITAGYADKASVDDFSTATGIDYTSAGKRSVYSIATEKTIHLVQNNPADGTRSWEYKHKEKTAGRPGLYNEIMPAVYKDCFLCEIGSYAILLNYDGTFQNDFHFSAPVVRFLNTDDNIRAILSNGNFDAYGIKDAKLYSNRNIFLAEIGEVYTCGPKESSSIITLSEDKSLTTRSYAITQYKWAGADNKWQDLEESSILSKLPSYGISYDGYGAYQNYFFSVITEDNASESTADRYSYITVWDSESGKIAKEYKMVVGESGQETYEDYDYWGLDQNTGELCFLKIDDSYTSDDTEKVHKLKTINIDSGEESERDLSITGIEGNLADEMLGSRISFSMDNNTVSPDDGKIYHCSVTCHYPTYEETQSDDYEDIEKYYFNLCVLDLGANEIQNLSHFQVEILNDDYYSMTVAVDKNTKRVLIRDSEGNLSCYDLSGNLKWQKTDPDFVSVAVTYTETGDIIALEDLSDKSKLHLLDPDTGEEINSVYLTEDANIVDKIKCSSISEDEYLLTTGLDAYILDKETLELRADIISVFNAYVPGTQTFVLGNSFSTNEKGIVPYRSVDALVQEAEEMLK